MNTENTDTFVDILGVKVKKRIAHCVKDRPIPTGFKLVVHVTDACPCSCQFCCNQSKGFSLDVEQFKRDYEEIIKRVQVDEVFFTGGEPMLYWDKIKECASVIKCAVTVHTAGLNLHLIDDPKFYVSLSRHHYDHAVNESILQTKLPESYIKDFRFKERMNIACNIIKGHIDNPEEMRKVLDFAIANEIPQVAFIGLMPINEYSKEHCLPVPRLVGDDILKYRDFDFSNGACHCANYCYHDKNGNLLTFYTRHNTCPSINHGGRIIYKNGIQPWFTQ